MKEILSSLFVGLLFGAGLGISGMMDPAKVQGFLDLTGRWDPSLALVMGGAMAVTWIAYPLIFKRKRPVLAPKFFLPTNTQIDRPLVLGALLFGTGWAIGGLCPGPALANLATLNAGVLAFVPSMLVGFWLHRSVSEWQIRQRTGQGSAACVAEKEAFEAEQCLVD